MFIYCSATEHLNKHPYLLKIPISYDPAVVTGVAPDEYTEYVRKLQPSDPCIMVRSMLPISHMIEMCVTKVPFEITHDRDVLEILHQIDAYLEEVSDRIAVNPQVKAYVAKVMQLRPKVYRLFKIKLNQHPEWRKAYREESGIISIIEDMYRNLGVSELTPIAGLAQAPALNQYDNRPLSEKLGVAGYDDV